MTKLRDIARIMSRTEDGNPDNKRLLIVGEAFDSALASPVVNSSIPASLTVYQSFDSLPSSGLSMGDQALVVDSAKFYISDGSAWYSTGALNEIPTWDAAFSATYEVTDEDTDLVISNTASDSDDPDGIFKYSGEVYAPQVPVANVLMTSITVDSDAGTWTFNAAPEATVSPVYDTGGVGGSTFKYIFKATDGINIISDSATIDWTFVTIPPITYPSQTTYGGTTYGYAIGGQSYTTRMERWSLPSDGNASNVGTLAGPMNQGTGSGASGTYGYVFGNGTQWIKYQYASGTGIYSVQDTTFPYPGGSGTPAVTGNRTKGYNIGGTWPSPSNSGVKNYYDRITYSNDTWTTNVGSLTNDADTYGFMANTSPTGQYLTGGAIYATSFPYGEAFGTDIKYFPFSSEGNTTDIGYDNLFPYSANQAGSAASSTTYGYDMGGVNYGPAPDTYHYTITKFPFANNANSTSVGNMAYTKMTRYAGVSSTTYGYGAGGITTPWSGASNGIGKFPFASDTNMSDVGDLSVTQYGQMGGQY